jgi:hypothetical protein
MSGLDGGEYQKLRGWPKVLRQPGPVFLYPLVSYPLLENASGCLVLLLACRPFSCWPTVLDPEDRRGSLP